MLRFCAYQYQHMSVGALAGRWRRAEELGFDVLWNCDTVVEPDRPRHVMFDVIPRTVQQPRLPITIAAHGPKMLQIAARFADGWSQWGGYDVETEADLYAITSEKM